MSYESALVAAGAKIVEFKEFGSYQGSWYAFVEYNGERGWVEGSYGSCSGCDSFQAEFGWSDDAGCDDHEWDKQADCPACAAKRVDYEKRLADFGRGYLDAFKPVEKILAQLDDHAEWDSESEEAAKWIRASGHVPDSRPCTCHPDDNPPQPCPRKYALSECRLAGPASATPEDKP